MLRTHVRQWTDGHEYHDTDLQEEHSCCSPRLHGVEDPLLGVHRDPWSRPAAELGAQIARLACQDRTALLRMPAAVDALNGVRPDAATADC